MLEETLKQEFGYESFRKGQKETIEKLLQGKNVLSIMPTGNGKSLCYQFPSYIWNEGLVLIVSPLISLMYDQVQQIQYRGEKRVVALNSLLDQNERKYILSHLKEYRFLFISPEMLMKSDILAVMKKNKIALFVVDEAHCISQWGIDFRPDYQQLGDIRESLGSPLTLALTATATKAVERDIVDILFKKDDVSILRQSVNRSNITYQVIETYEKDQFLLTFLAKYAGPGIIYFSSKKKANEVNRLLIDRLHIRSAVYHADISALDRSRIQQQFLNQELEILCATTAFGMGVNKQDIRFVIHYHLSASLEDFVQESGRAGRDGKPSLSILLYQKGDENIHTMLREESFSDLMALKYIKTQEEMKALEDRLSPLQKKWSEHVISDKVSRDEFQAMILKKENEKRRQLQAMMDYINTTTCRRKKILDYFEEQEEPHTIKGCCDFSTIVYDDILEARKDYEEKQFSVEDLIEQLFPNLG